jgi:nucleoside-diphosphate-sugar epimerase
MKIVYVTGCLGFIGSYVTRKCLQRGWMVYGVDKCTYVANRGLLEEFGQYDNFTFLEKDIKDLDHLYDCDYIINTAAESHVGILALMRFMEILSRVNIRKNIYYTPATLIQPQKPPQTCLYWLGQEPTM